MLQGEEDGDIQDSDVIVGEEEQEVPVPIEEASNEDEGATSVDVVDEAETGED